VAAFEAKAVRRRLLLAISAILIVLKCKLKSLKQRIHSQEAAQRRGGEGGEKD
jgi:hypothetical protein